MKRDTTAPSGSRVITVFHAGTGTSFIADSFSVQHPTGFLDQRDQNNEPLGGVYVDDFMTGSATLQLAASTTRYPVPGDMFAEKPDPNDVDETDFIISEVSNPEERGALKRITINFRKAYVPPSEGEDDPFLP